MLPPAISADEVIDYMKNMLLEKVEYQVEETPRGVWRRFAYPDGRYFAEFRSHSEYFGLPFIHYTRGICPETGRRIVAKGVIAIGRIATGGIALGQLSAGVIAFGQAGIGLIFCFAQASAGLYSAGQLALGVIFGVGQFACGITAVGQFAVGKYVLAQFGFGTHRWIMGQADPTAIEHFRQLWAWMRSLLPHGN